jgi:predicted nucleic acid-binding protein
VETAAAAAKSTRSRSMETDGTRMNAVVDTNVVAYYLLNTEPHVEECGQFWRRIAEVSAPASWQAELLSVLWMAVKQKVITLDECAHRLRIAYRLGIRSVPVHQLWRGSLIRASHSGLSPYDILFVELAVRRKVQLATFDAGLLRRFPDIAKRPVAIF